MQILPAQAKLLQVEHSATKTRLFFLEQHHFLKDMKYCHVPTALNTLQFWERSSFRTVQLGPGRRGHSSPAIVSLACTTFAIIPPQPRVKPDLIFQMQIRMTLRNPSEQTRQCFLGFLPKLTPVIPLHSLPSTEPQPAPHSHCISKFVSLDPPQLII